MADAFQQPASDSALRQLLSRISKDSKDMILLFISFYTLYIHPWIWSIFSEPKVMNPFWIPLLRLHTYCFVCFDYSMCAVFCSAVAKALVSRPTRPARLSNSTYVCWISKSKTVQILEVYWANWATVIQLHANLHKAFTQPFVEIEQHPDLHFQPGHSKAANVKAVKASPTELVFKRTPAAQACISCAQHEWTAL